jgi:uncharacterized repeat protein (TIGR03899 family)
VEQKRAPITIEQDTASEAPKSTQSQRKSTVKDSASRVKHIAEHFNLAALLKDELPEHSLLQRANQRDAVRKERRQKNLEHIIKHTLVACKDEAAGDPDADWLYRYFDLAQDIGNASMQRLWAQVLKREITNPSSTSIKSLIALRDMSPKEAQTLQRASSLACSFGADSSKKLLMGFKGKKGFLGFGSSGANASLNLGNFQLPYSSLLLLIELGLILSTELESGEIEPEPALTINYQGKQVALQANSKGNRLVYYRFSPIGNELCTLLGNKPNMKYYDQLVALLSQKFTVTTEVQSSVDHTV